MAIHLINTYTFTPFGTVLALASGGIGIGGEATATLLYEEKEQATSGIVISGSATPTLGVVAEGEVSVGGNSDASINIAKSASAAGDISIDGDAGTPTTVCWPLNFPITFPIPCGSNSAVGRIAIGGSAVPTLGLEEEEEATATVIISGSAAASVGFSAPASATGDIVIGGASTGSLQALVLTRSATGNVSIGGSATSSINIAQSASAVGDISITGSATSSISISANASATGSIVVGGSISSASISQPATGGIAIGGSAVASINIAQSASAVGNIAIGGSATSSTTCWPLNFPVSFPMPCGAPVNATGNIVISGSATASTATNTTVNPAATGNIVISGSATASTTTNIIVNPAATGNVVIGGSATAGTSLGANGVATGNIVIGGSATGVTSMGSSTTNATATGNIIVSGSATATLGTGASGTATGNIVIGGSATATASTPLANNWAVSCDGADDHINLNSNFASVLNSSFSVSFWINLPEGQPSGSGHSTTSNSNIFGYSDSTSNTNRFFCLIGRGGLSEAGKLRIYYKAGGGTQVQARTTNALFSSGATGWVHVTITVEEANHGIKVYKNGSAVSVDEVDYSMSSVTMSNFSTNTGDFLVGARSQPVSGGTNYYQVNADFDEFAIFNTALTSSQVSDVYNSGDAYDLDGHSNLEGWWRMGDGTENGSGTTVYDMSSNSSNATLVNGAKYSTSFPAPSSTSIELDGANDYLSTDLVTNTYGFKDGFTASLWIKLDDNSTTQDFFGRYGNGSARWYFGISGTYVRAAIGTSWDASTISHGLSTGTWHHVAYTFTGGTSGTFTYYLDGSSVGTKTYTWTADSGAYEPMHIGALKNGNTLDQNRTNGKIDELALYNSALSSSDISAIYNSGSPADQSSDSNLVAYWRMQGSGHQVTDSSTNSNTAILENGATFSTNIPYSGRSIDFDGTDDYIEISDHDDFSFGNGTTDSSFSISAWAKLDSTDRQRFITKSNSSNAEWLFGTSWDNKLAFTLYDNTGSAYNYKVSTATISTGQWYHFVGTYDGSSFKLYINGSEDTGSAGSLNYTAMHNTSAPVHIGKYDFANQFNNGKLDDVAIWNSVLTSSEVASIALCPRDLTQDFYNYTSSGTLVGFWKLEDNANDSSGNGHNGTSSGGPTTSTDTPS